MEPKLVFHFDKEKLEKTKRFVLKNAKVKVGVLGSSEKGSYSTGISAVVLTAVHEFGSKRRGIPERSFLRKTYVNNMERFRADFLRQSDMLSQRILSGQGMAVMNEIGAKWVAWVIETFEKEGPGWAPLSPARIAQRSQTGRAAGNAAPQKFPILRDTGAMARSITYEVV